MDPGGATPSVDDDDAWREWREQWGIRADTTYLNHGSFGPPPAAVRQAQLEWQQALAEQPMDFFVRRYELAWLAARERLAKFVGTSADQLVFLENATAAMNVVADSFSLGEGDEVLLTDHEYGAVRRIWHRACRRSGAQEPRFARLPARMDSTEHVVDSIFSAATPRTRLLIVSHVTSPTAIVLPVNAICAEAQRRGIAVCIDGPHAPAQVPLVLDDLPCDFYAASLHKWVSAPMGAGFLFVAPRWQRQIRTPLLSWGRVAPREPTTWWDEFVWTGTRDPSAYFASTAAIELLERVGLPAFRARTHHLAARARHELAALTGLAPSLPDGPEWYGSMISARLPEGAAAGLQRELWERYRIEVPIIEHNGCRSIRVSFHLYNGLDHLEYLLRSLRAALGRGL